MSEAKISSRNPLRIWVAFFFTQRAALVRPGTDARFRFQHFLIGAGIGVGFRHDFCSFYEGEYTIPGQRAPYLTWGIQRHRLREIQVQRNF